jgi:hypothetical protein
MYILKLHVLTIPALFVTIQCAFAGLLRLSFYLCRGQGAIQWEPKQALYIYGHVNI